MDEFNKWMRVAEDALSQCAAILANEHCQVQLLEPAWERTLTNKVGKLRERLGRIIIKVRVFRAQAERLGKEIALCRSKVT